MADLEDDVFLPREATASPVKRSFKRLKRKGDLAPTTFEINPTEIEIEANELQSPNTNKFTEHAESHDEFEQRKAENDAHPEQEKREVRMGESDDDSDLAAYEESDEEEELARMLAKEKEVESEGEGGNSEDDSCDRGSRQKAVGKDRREHSGKDAEGSEAEAEELDFDRDRDEDEYEGPSQPDVLLKKHKRKRPGEEEDIHAESQRLLRETRGVAFKAHVTVQKPLSGLLEKIRKRKEELFKASQPPERNRAPERPRPYASKALPEDASKTQRRIGESSDEEEEADDDDSDDEVLLEIITSRKEKERGAERVKQRLPEDSPVTGNDGLNQDGYEGDLEEDDEELTFDFLDRSPGKEKIETQDLKTRAPRRGEDGFGEEDEGGEEKAELPQNEERPFFPIFQRKVAKVPKFNEPVEDAPATSSEPQFDDENVEPVPGSEFQDGQAPEEEAAVASDAENEDDLFDFLKEKIGPDVKTDASPSQADVRKRKAWECDGSDDDLLDKPETARVPSPPKARSKMNEAVRRFVDDEAEEEDSDGNLGNLSDDDEDPAAADDMEYVIDTRAEAVIDNGEKERVRLHREWVEQQDAKDTKELLDRIKNGWHRPGAAGVLMDSDEDDDLDADDLRKRRMRLKAAARAKAEAFGDDCDAGAFAADEEAPSEDDGPGSEDEEFREQVLRRRRLQESESLEPESLDLAADDASREVLGLMKRAGVPAAGLPNVPSGKENAHGSLLGLFSKRKKALKSSSSFLNRACTTSRDASNVTTANAGSGTGRYFIFGRDDSNSALERRETIERESDTDTKPLNPSTNTKAPTNFAGIASRVGAHKKVGASGALAPSAFFGLLSRGANSESQERDALPAELPSFLWEVRPAKKTAFVR